MIITPDKTNPPPINVLITGEHIKMNDLSKTNEREGLKQNANVQAVAENDNPSETIDTATLLQYFVTCLLGDREEFANLVKRTVEQYDDELEDNYYYRRGDEDSMKLGSTEVLEGIYEQIANNIYSSLISG